MIPQIHSSTVWELGDSSSCMVSKQKDDSLSAFWVLLSRNIKNESTAEDLT